MREKLEFWRRKNGFGESDERFNLVFGDLRFS